MRITQKSVLDDQKTAPGVTALVTSQNMEALDFDSF